MSSAVSLRGVSKAFGPVQALDSVDFELAEREIHALVGENGAGKTTLMRILAGLEQPDAGRIEIAGRNTTIPDPQTASRLGIGMVHQRFQLHPSLTVLENVVLGAEPSSYGLFGKRRAMRQVGELAERYGFDIDPGARVSSLPVGVRQRVEILKALHRGADILIFDEPTSVLTPQETQGLFGILRSLKDDGKAIIYISHKIWEVLEVSDRISVLRRGRNGGEVPTREATAEVIAERMVGHELPPLQRAVQREVGAVAVEAHDLEVEDDRGVMAVRGVTFSVRKGEIVGLAGVEGNGQRELIEALAGLRVPTSGEVVLGGQTVTRYNLYERRRLGLALIPEDRDREGVCAQLSIAENLLGNRYRDRPYALAGVLQRRPLLELSHDLMGRYAVRAEGPSALVKTLSGGNVQKVVVARELSGQPQVVLAVHPSRGIDIGAMRAVHQELLDLASAGSAILLVSGDLDEIFALSDRILTLFEGTVTGEVARATATREVVGRLMLGTGRAAA
jgi:general nucleoside transport system ATP-binding protein